MKKVTAEFKVTEDGKAELNIEVQKGEDVHPTAYFDEKGRLTGVNILKSNENGDYSFDIKNGNYKIMLWDKFKPIIQAIKQ